LQLVEDAACAIGARYKGRLIGSSGSLACFSLHPRKVITSGEGGMITTSDPEIADRLRKLRQHAMDLSDLARHNAQDVVFESYPERGWNVRMTDMQAALGICQLAVLDEILAERRRQAERYTAALEQLPGLEPPHEPLYAERTWQSYPVRVSPSFPLDRTELMRRLHHDGVATRRGVMAIHQERAYADPDAWLPHTERAALDTLLLPLFPGLGDEAQDHVIERVAAHTLALAA
jgi:perosamine synthetase